jgi:hypothetical protein
MLRAGANLGTEAVGRTVLLTYVLDGPADAAPQVLTIDTDRISAIATTPDGSRILIAAADGQTRADGRLLVHHVGDVRPSGSLGPPADNLAVLRFDPSGSLLSGGADSGFMAWTVDRAEWERRACAAAARELTLAEWRDALGEEPWRPTCDPDASPVTGAAEVPASDPGDLPGLAPASPAPPGLAPPDPTMASPAPGATIA